MPSVTVISKVVGLSGDVLQVTHSQSMVSGTYTLAGYTLSAWQYIGNVIQATITPKVTSGTVLTAALDVATIPTATSGDVVLAWMAETSPDGDVQNLSQYAEVVAATDGYYATVADLTTWLGLQNLIYYSDVDMTGSANAARVTEALAEADRHIDLALRLAGINSPVATTSAYYPGLTEVAIKLAAYWLYSPMSPRSDEDQMNSQGAIIKVRTWRKRAATDLLNLIIYARDLPRASTAPIYPSGV